MHLGEQDSFYESSLKCCVKFYKTETGKQCLTLNYKPETIVSHFLITCHDLPQGVIQIAADSHPLKKNLSVKM